MKNLKITLTAIMATTFLATTPAIASTGEEIFQETCIACHGEDGKGAFPGIPDFTKKDGRLAKTDEVLIKHITEGFQTSGSQMAMPPKGGNEDLTEADIKNVLKYIRTTFKQ